MGKIVFFGDVHLGNYRMPIEPYILRAMECVADIVGRERPAMTIFVGDAFRSRTPSTGHITSFGRMIDRIARYSDRVLLVPGNHDKLAYGATIDVFGLISENVHVAKGPGYMSVSGTSPCIIAVPWLTKMPLSSDIDSDPSMMTSIRVVLDFLKADLDSTGVCQGKIMVAHCATLEGRLDGGQMSTLSDDVLWPASFFDGYDLSILGHYHRPQQVYPNVYYTGSICPLNFGEMGQRKEILIYDLGDKSISHVRIPTPNLYRIDTAKDPRADGDAIDLSEWEFEPDTFLQIVSSREVSIINKPDSVVWYETIIRPEREDRVVRLDSEIDQVTPRKAIETYLEQAGHADKIEDVLALANKIMEE